MFGQLVRLQSWPCGFRIGSILLESGELQEDTRCKQRQCGTSCQTSTNSLCTSKQTCAQLHLTVLHPINRRLAMKNCTLRRFRLVAARLRWRAEMLLASVGRLVVPSFVSASLSNSFQKSRCFCSISLSVAGPIVLLQRAHDSPPAQRAAKNSMSLGMLIACLVSLPP